MNFSLKNFNDRFTFYKNGSLIKVSENNPLLAANSKHAKLILKDLKKKEVYKDPFSMLSLSMFASSIDKNQVNEIIVVMLKNLDFDLLLFRFFDDKELLKLINKEYDPFIIIFNKIFNMKLTKVEDLTTNKNCLTDKKLLKKFILKLGNFIVFNRSLYLHVLTLYTKLGVYMFFFISTRLKHVVV